MAPSYIAQPEVKKNDTAEQLAAEQLAAEQLAAEQLAAEQLAAEQLAAEQLAAEQLAAEQLAAEQLAAEQLAAEQLAAEKLAAEQLAAEQLAAEQLAAEQLAAEQLAAEQLAAEQLAAEQLAAEQLAAEQLAAEQLAAEQLAAEQLAAEQLAAEQLAAEQLAAEQLAAEQLAAEQLAAEQLAAEKRQKASVIRHVEATPGRVVIESDGLIETFKYFTLTDPPRLIVDIYNLEPSFDERTFYAINGFNKIRLGTHADKVRLVFDASESQLPVYKVEKRSEGIVVSWDEPESTLIAEAQAVVIDNSESEQSNAEKIAASKLAAEQAEAEKIAAAKLAVEHAEEEKIAAAKLAAEQAEAEKIAAAKLAAEQAEAEKIAATKLAAEQAEAEKIAAAKLAAEQAEAEKIAAAKLATEKAEAETVATQNQQAAEEQGKQEIRLSPHFPSFDTTLQPSDLVMLEKLAKQLKSQKLSRVDVVGHSDNLPILERSRHIFADNLALSEARARSVVEYLQNQLGVPSEVINLRGLGDSKPMADNSTEAGRALNRRVEVSLVTGPVNSANQQEFAKDTDVLQPKEVTELSPSECDIVATN
jgi:flagellar motor protein MotB